MRPAEVALAAVAAVTVQTTLAWSVSGTTVVNLDLSLVVVVLAALSGGPLAGLWSGAATGFAQDVLSGGIVGVSGLSKCVVGVVAGLVGARLLVTALWQQGLVTAAATFFHAGFFFGIYALISNPAPIIGWRNVADQAVANALAAGVAAGIVGPLWRWPQIARRRRAQPPLERWRSRYAP